MENHSVSGCEKLAKVVTLRHNRAGTTIVEAIAAGTKGHQLIAADVGLNKKRKAQGLPTMNITRTSESTLPQETLPSAMPAEIRKQLSSQSIPDALLFEFDRKKRKRRYTVVELKYCKDTDPSRQQSNATGQHHDLVQMLTKYDTTAEIKQCNLMLGVGGII